MNAAEDDWDVPEPPDESNDEGPPAASNLHELRLKEAAPGVLLTEHERQAAEWSPDYRQEQETNQGEWIVARWYRDALDI